MSDFIKEVSPEEAHLTLKENSTKLLLDVREPEEYEEIHAQGAILKPLSSFEAIAIARDLNISTGDEFFIICRSGARSMKAAELFAQHGFKNAVNIAGGTLGWAQAGLPVKR